MYPEHPRSSKGDFVIRYEAARRREEVGEVQEIMVPWDQVIRTILITVRILTFTLSKMRCTWRASKSRKMVHVFTELQRLLV